jgi:hypothetical protein
VPGGLQEGVIALEKASLARAVARKSVASAAGLCEAGRGEKTFVNRAKG